MESFLRCNALRTSLLMKSITAVKLKNEELFVHNVNISFFGFYYYRICQNFLSSKIRTMLGVVFSSIFLVVYIANSCNCLKIYDVTKYGASAGKKDNQAVSDRYLILIQNICIMLFRFNCFRLELMSHSHRACLILL